MPDMPRGDGGFHRTFAGWAGREAGGGQLEVGPVVLHKDNERLGRRPCNAVEGI